MATETVPVIEAPRTPEEIERHWFENVYAGDRMPQLTVRAPLGARRDTASAWLGRVKP